MIVCYQSCKCCLELIKLSIESIEKNNENVIFFIFNNKITYFHENQSIERKKEYEYSKEDIKEIKKLCKRLIIVNNNKWMDIFDECPTKKEQTNTFSRLLFSRFFQKLNNNEQLKIKINEYLSKEDKMNSSKEDKIKNITKYIYCDEDVICDGPIDTFWNLSFDHNFFKGFRNSFAKRNVTPLFRMKPLINDGLQLVNSDFRINDPEYIKLINVQIICKVIGKVVCRTQALTNWYGIDDIVLTTKDFDSLHESARIRQLLCLKYYHICHTDGNKNNLPVMRRVHKNLIEKYKLFDENSIFYVL